MPRRARLHEVLSDLVVMERLLVARLNVPEPGASLSRDSLVVRLVDARKLVEQFVPAGARTPPGPRDAAARSIYVSPYGKGGLVARGPGLDDARAGARMVADGLMEVADVLTIKAQRITLPPGAERVRVSILGRCLASHLVLNARVNRTWRLRFFGSSQGVRTGTAAPVAFITSEGETESIVPKQELWLDIPAAMLQDGENTFEITAQTLVAEMGSNTVFCPPSLHEIRWGPVP